MSKVEKLSDRQYIFGMVFIVANRVDTMLEREFKSENSYDFWKKLRAEGTSFTQALFKNIDKDELEVARRVMQKLNKGGLL